jgi:hypothetical protein
MSTPDFGVVISSLSTAMSMAKGFFALKSEAERQQERAASPRTFR